MFKFTRKIIFGREINKNRLQQTNSKNKNLADFFLAY
jgi:hypothetical protein